MEEIKAVNEKRLAGLIKEYVGKSFGKLTITEIIGVKKKRTVVMTACECGKTREVYLYNLLRNHTKSCGCVSLAMRNLNIGHLKHGDAFRGKEAPEYGAYMGMKTSIISKSEKVRAKYKKYDRLGISICCRWLDKESGYKNFLEDMGRKPEKNYKLARIDRKKGFSKDNCEWRGK